MCILWKRRTSILRFNSTNVCSPELPKNDIIWKSLGCRLVNGVPLGSPAAKTLGACGPSSFGLETSLRTPFTTLPPRLFQIMSHSAHYTLMHTVPFNVSFTMIYPRLFHTFSFFQPPELLKRDLFHWRQTQPLPREYLGHSF